MELLKLNQKVPAENQTKVSMLYSEESIEGFNGESCGKVVNIIGFLVLVLLIILIIHFFIKNRGKRLDIIKENDIGKLLIGLLLLTHVRILTSSLTDNIVVPILMPVVPYLKCNFTIKFFDDNIIYAGKFMSDLFIFIINLVIIYFITFIF